MSRVQIDVESRKIWNGNLETSYSPEDLVNVAWNDPRHYPTAYVILNAGFVLAIVFGEQCEQDALDTAVDDGKLNGLQCDETELADYQIGMDSEGNPEYEGISFLGNASEPFADESLDIWIVPSEPFKEDSSTMSWDRVVKRLEDMRYQAYEEYKKVDVHSEQWSTAYRKVADLDDTITHCRLTALR